jgi:hypothetical protein
MQTERQQRAASYRAQGSQQFLVVDMNGDFSLRAVPSRIELSLIPLLIAITFHEAAHGYIARNGYPLHCP